MDGEVTVEQLIIARLDRLDQDIKIIGGKVDLCRVEIAGLKVKAGVWGALAGLIPVVIGMGMWVMSAGG